MKFKWGQLYEKIPDPMNWVLFLGKSESAKRPKKDNLYLYMKNKLSSIEKIRAMFFPEITRVGFGTAGKIKV